jgi:double-stranded uracil-DNA glycosylase
LNHPNPQPLLQGLPPLLTSNTRLVILGSFPSVKSLASQQYYAHPQNQMWRLVFSAFNIPDAIALSQASYEQRTAQLVSLGVGLWDVYAACERQGSLDSAIAHAQLNDLASLRVRCPQLRAIAHNGGESYRHAKTVDTMINTLPASAPTVAILKLPSSSPANASWSFERKLAAWRDAFEPYTS